MIAFFCCWLFALFFFVLIGYYFFNNDIWVNLYKLNFLIPPLFHPQPKHKWKKLKYILFSHFFITSPFSIFPLFYHFFFFLSSHLFIPPLLIVIACPNYTNYNSFFFFFFIINSNFFYLQISYVTWHNVRHFSIVKIDFYFRL